MLNVQNNAELQENLTGTNEDLRISQKFIVNLKGKQFVTYEGLLDMSHQKGIQALETDLIAMPCDANQFTAIAKATLIGKDGSKFVEYGDANGKSVNTMIAPHIIRMALTRAKARAMRDFTNIGMCSLDEVNIDDIQEDDTPASDKQKAILKNNQSEIGLSDEDIENVTKSQASILIDKIFNKVGNKNSQGAKQQVAAPNKQQQTQQKQQAQGTQQAQNKSNTAGGGFCSAAQVGFMKKLIIDLVTATGREYNNIQAEILQAYNAEALEKLSPVQARQVINKLQQKSA